mmetsp:Transcript_85011/g.238025  ORF Transcript_85011/g.238025 Transcript_85011/m.238025 type:complete len:413 (+) Transcript_85011:1168-2406(+)
MASPAKRARTDADEAALQARVKELEAERDMWRAKAQGSGVAFPATHWPAGKPSLVGPPAYPQYDQSKPKESFLAVCDMLIDEVCAELGPGYEMPEAEVAWARRMLNYNVRGGKMNRGLMVIDSGVHILKAKQLPASNDTIVRFAILGWCIEWLQGWLLVADDFMDDSKTRRGQKCWYLHDDVQKIAINDAFFTEMLVYKVLKRHFSHLPYYAQLVDLMMETTFQTECGQLLDSICANCTLEELTLERWTLIVKYKTAFYSFYLPVALSMLVTGVRDPAAFNKAREVLLMMGVYFQAQDDYLDAFANPEELGKVGTDIQDKKCSWLFAHAYHQHGTEESRAMLANHYGKCKVGSEEELGIKDLYRSLGLQELYAEYEANTMAKMQEYRLEVEANGLPWSVFERFFELIYKRRK